MNALLKKNILCTAILINVMETVVFHQFIYPEYTGTSGSIQGFGDTVVFCHHRLKLIERRFTNVNPVSEDKIMKKVQKQKT